MFNDKCRESGLREWNSLRTENWSGGREGGGEVGFISKHDIYVQPCNFIIFIL